MAANRSQRQIRSAILLAPVADYRGWELVAVCAPCGRQRMIPAEALGAGTVTEGVRRLRCSGCGGRPTRVLIVSPGADWRQRTVVLEGRGAYW